MSQLSLAFGTEHFCTACGASFRCDEDECAVPAQVEGPCCRPQLAHLLHHDWAHNRAKREPAYAAKLGRIEARQRNCSNPLQILQPNASGGRL